MTKPSYQQLLEALKIARSMVSPNSKGELKDLCFIDEIIKEASCE